MKTNYIFNHYLGRGYILKEWTFKSASHQERKMACAHNEYVRPKRKYKNLPDSYDDIWPSRFLLRSWKDVTKRRKQWMRD